MITTQQMSRSFLFPSQPSNDRTQDSAIALGTAFKQALGPVRGIRRYGTGFAPLDEVNTNVIISTRTISCLVSRPFHALSLTSVLDLTV